ncbi:hypothetical protein D3C81_2254390 [compost metagenome]
MTDFALIPLLRSFIECSSGQVARQILLIDIMTWVVMWIFIALMSELGCSFIVSIPQVQRNLG